MRLFRNERKAKPSFVSDDTRNAGDKVIDAKLRVQRAGLAFRRSYFLFVFDCWRKAVYETAVTERIVRELQLDLVCSGEALIN